MKITRADLQKNKFCFKGARKFFAKHSLDWQDFVKNGISIQKIIAVNDAMSNKIVDYVKNKKSE